MIAILQLTIIILSLIILSLNAEQGSDADLISSHIEAYQAMDVLAQNKHETPSRYDKSSIPNLNMNRELRTERDIAHMKDKRYRDRPIRYHRDMSSTRTFQSNNTTGGKIFSGLYEPEKYPGVLEAFSGAFLVHRKRFLNEGSFIRLKQIEDRGIEPAIFAFYFEGINLMTRDFFDFQVIHLSSTTNQLPNLRSPDIHNTILSQMRNTVKILEHNYNQSASSVYRKSTERIMKSTVVIVPYTTKPGSQNVEDVMQALNKEIRLLYLRATFYSVHRYFPRFVITVLSKADEEYVRSLGLTIWKIVSFPEIKDGTLLPKESLLYVRKKMHDAIQSNNLSDEDKEWSSIMYVYYTESDQILHARGLPHIIHIMERMNGSIAVMPHRMQTMALPRLFPNYRNSFYNHHPSKIAILDSVDLRTEDPISPLGSCCDDSRFRFKNCGNWWYNCDFYGLHNYTTWARFGVFGYTLPLGTEHQAKCKYSSKKVLCPIPKDCKRRSPRYLTDICQEMPNPVVVG